MGKRRAVPSCVFCHRSDGVTFEIFNPRFPPFGTACTDCEARLPPGASAPAVTPAPTWRRGAATGDIAGIERMIGEFWPASGYTVDPVSLAVLRNGHPYPTARVTRKGQRLRFEIRDVPRG